MFLEIHEEKFEPNKCEPNVEKIFAIPSRLLNWPGIINC